jgi:hypothetical protein
MSKRPSKKSLPPQSRTKQPAPVAPSDSYEKHILAYARSRCAIIDGDADREALRLLSSVGLFSATDPSKFFEALRRVRGVAATSDDDRLVAARERVERTASSKTRRKALDDLDEITYEILEGSMDAAYLLGVAMGRRLGPQSLRPLGGAR